jgi:hypothetical protein
MLERAEVIERRQSGGGRTRGYRLTPAGRDLAPVVRAVGEWGATWAFPDPQPGELAPDLLIAGMARESNPERFPPGRTVVQFDFREPRKRFWLVLEPEEISVCLEAPGFEVDLTVAADTGALYRVYFGRTSLRDALRAGGVTLTGASRLQKAFATWFAWSGFAAALDGAPARRAAAERLPAPRRVAIGA